MSRMYETKQGGCRAVSTTILNGRNNAYQGWFAVREACWLLVRSACWSTYRQTQFRCSPRALYPHVASLESSLDHFDQVTASSCVESISAHVVRHIRRNAAEPQIGRLTATLRLQWVALPATDSLLVSLRIPIEIP